MRFEVLGPLRVRREGVEVAVTSGSQRRVLAALLARADGRVSVTELVDALWPDDPPGNAAKNVQSYVAKLKHALGTPDLITFDQGGYAVSLDKVSLDAQEFTGYVREAGEACRSGNPGVAGTSVDVALGLWRGRPYGDLHDWMFLRPEIERLDKIRLEAFEIGVELGRHGDVLPELTALVDAEPYRERPVGLLMRALYASGRPADAQALYRRIRTKLAEDLGIDPSADLEGLHQTMLRGDPALASRSIVSPGHTRSSSAEPSPTPPGGGSAQEETRVVLVDGMPRPPKAVQERTDLLGALRSLGDKNEPAVVCSLTGARGVGKTQLAAAYARVRIAEGWTVVWVDAESREQLVAGLANLADVLGRRHPREDSEYAAKRARRWLSSLRTPALLILDNATDPDSVREWLPPTGAVQAVVTSNRRVFGWLGGHVEVDVFTVDQARTFLSECTGLPTDDADRLADAVGHNALALALAAAVITGEHLTYRDYIQRLEALPVDEVLAAHDGDPYPRSVGEAIRLSLTAVEQHNTDARMVAELLAVMAPSGVTRSVLIPAKAAEEIKAARSKALSLLVDASMATYSQHGQSVLMHRLTRRVVREHATRDSRLSSIIADATGLLGERLQTIAGYPHRRQDADEICSHLETLMSTTELSELDRTDLLGLLDLGTRTIAHLHDTSDSARTIELNRAVLAVQERVLGTDDPATLRSRARLAWAYWMLGQVDEAAALSEQTFASQKQTLGADHPDTLRTSWHLAGIYLASGRTDLAIVLLEQTSTDQTQALDSDHSCTQGISIQPAWAHRWLDRISVAVRLYEQIARDTERVLGADDIVSLTARADLALAYRAAGRLDEAVPLLEQNLSDCELGLGTDHPGTLHRRNNLAGAYRAVGRSDEAIRLFEHTLADRERVMGADHANTLQARNNLACAYHSAGRLDEATELFERTLIEYNQEFGTDKPRTLNVHNNLACTYLQTGQTIKAIGLLEITLADRERILGTNHPDTFTSTHNLAVAYQTAGQTNNAAPLFERSNHPSAPTAFIADLDAPWVRNGFAATCVAGIDETIRLPTPINNGVTADAVPPPKGSKRRRDHRG